jgi:cytochrome c7-like protein
MIWKKRSDAQEVRSSRRPWSKRRLLWVGISIVTTAGIWIVANAGTSPGTAGATAEPAAPKTGQATTPATVANPHGELKVACEACHTADSWTAVRSPLRFDHATSGFPLQGRHRTTACTACHKSLVFSRVATSCADCHRDVHEGRNGLRCQDCHSPERWVQRSDAVRRHASTSFPLRGVHALLECTRCHTGADEAHLTRVSSECVSCHASEYAATQNPNHAAAGFPTRCEECHDVARAQWAGTGFNHSTTGFPLTGAHGALACTACHTRGTYAGLSSECYSCHRPQYEATQNPNHVAARFSTQCASCHNTTSWAGATFDHATTGFPLTGAHRSLACTACHTGGTYAGLSPDCYSCHRADYEATNNPNHAAAGFPTTCASCHTTSAWQPASFNHDGLYFRIYSGRHQGRWNSCADCHTNPSSFADFSCFQCHSQAETDPHHTQVQGYRYESAACYSCHRNV